VLSRRAGLSAADQRRLELALASSDGLRCLHELGTNFDGLETSLSQDEMLPGVLRSERGSGGWTRANGWHLGRAAAGTRGWRRCWALWGGRWFLGCPGAGAFGADQGGGCVRVGDSRDPGRAGSTSALVAPRPRCTCAVGCGRCVRVGDSRDPGPSRLELGARRLRVRRCTCAVGFGRSAIR